MNVANQLQNDVCPNLASSTMPSLESSNSGGELLQKDHIDLNSEFKFYSRRRLNQMRKDQIVDSSPIQSQTPGNKPSTILSLQPLKIVSSWKK